MPFHPGCFILYRLNIHQEEDPGLEPIRLAVRRLVEHVLRAGNIDNRYVDSSAMLDGARAHRMLQKQMGEGYEKEVSLKLLAEADGLPVLVYGRADGLLPPKSVSDPLIIDEIKTTTTPLERFMELYEVHLAQAKCYGHMLLSTMEFPPPSITLQLTYYHLDTKELLRKQFSFTREELSAFFDELLARYVIWLHFEQEWAALREASIRPLPFPFPNYREGQRKLAVAAYSAIESKKRLYTGAPTGTGKTLAALFPSIKAIGEGKVEKIFYLTAKTVTRAVAEEALQRMAADGLRLKSITLRAKEKLCPLPEPLCNPDHCPIAAGHYDRVNDALLALLRENDLLTPDIILAYARQHRVCPHEFQLDATEWADMIVGDYNHVFDPVAYLHRFFSDGGGNYVFLVDEAHNLADRVRGMYTATLQKSAFSKVRKALKDKNAVAIRLKKSMSELNKYLIALHKELTVQTHAHAEADVTLNGLVAEFVMQAEAWLYRERQSAHPLQEELQPLYFEASFFLQIAGIYGPRFTTILDSFGSDLSVTLFCMDPSGIIAEKLRYARAAILFSATISPLPYYKDTLGGDAQDGMLELTSPFEKDRLQLIAHAGISTKYVDRPKSIFPIVEAIGTAIAHRKGNYIVYFPSYEYLSDVYALFQTTYPSIRTILQQTDMDDASRQAFLLEFSEENPETLLGFCVLGGIFSEGIDLVGERLVGAIIVGVGLPKITFRQDLIRACYDGQERDGFAYAYVYPGMNKVLQAAGRVIRTESDSGLVLLIDSRFATPRYRALFPAHWENMRTVYATDALKKALGIGQS